MRIVLSSIALFFATLALFAQTPHAMINGSISDPKGQPVSGAAIALRDLSVNSERMTTSAPDGSFRIADLPSGMYALTITGAGFAPFVRSDVELVIGQTRRLVVTLSSATLSETVDVKAESSGLDPTRASMQTVVDTERIEELPVQSRNYLEFVLLAPGIVASPRGTSSAPGDSGFSFAGLRPRSNVLTIDGLSNNDEYSGASRTELSPETVKEFEVVGRSWSAEQGGGSGGTINVVTKSGVNTFHGDAFLLGESGRLDARPLLEETEGRRPALTRTRTGGAFGGPLVADRTFFYTAGEIERMRGEAASDLDAITAGTISAALSSQRYSNASLRTLHPGLFATALDETELSGKITHALTEREALAVRVASTTHMEQGTGLNRGALADASARGDSSGRDIAATAALSSIIGEQMTNEVRGQLAVRRTAQQPSTTAGPAFSIAGIADFGSTAAGRSAHRQSYAELGETAGRAIGSHFLRTGGDVTRTAIRGVNGEALGGAYLFRSLEDFAAGNADSFRQVFGDPDVAMSATRSSAFVQDEWSLPSLTLTGGLRLEQESLPSRLHIRDRQLTPRLGFAWNPTAKVVIRGGGGIFADRIPLVAIERALTVDGRNAYEQIAGGATASSVLASARGGPLSSAVAGVAPSIYTARSGSWNPSSRQVSVGADYLVTPLLTASAALVVTRGVHLLRTVNVNLPPTTVLTMDNAAALGVPVFDQQQLGRPVFGPQRIDSRYDSVYEVQPTASSSYRGLTLSLNRRMASEIEWAAAYTFSKATDDASDFDEQPENLYALANERAASRFDQRHRFVASALIELRDADDIRPGVPLTFVQRILGNFELAPIVTIESGRPANVLTGSDDNRSGAFPTTARPLGIRRNSERLPASATINMRLLKYIPMQPHGKLDLVIEAFNLLNRRNVTERQLIWGTSRNATGSFGRALEAAGSRRIDCSIDFEF